MSSVSRVALVAACALLPAMGSPVRAQDFTPLEGIVIYSANRTPTDAAKVGSSVEVVTEKDLESRSQTYLKDYLETLPGVGFSQSGPPGSVAGITIRGASKRYVKVLVDGMDISDPSEPQTGTAFEHLLVGDVSRIEVLKGSQSTLYGGDAVGGVISIETKSARKLGFSQSGGAEYGAYNTWRGAYTAGYLSSNGSNIALTVQGVSSDGFSAAAIGREKDGYENLTFSGKGEYYLSPTAKIFFAARSMRARYEYDGFPPPTYSLADTDDYGRTIQHAGRVGTEFQTFGGALTNTFALQAVRTERDTFSGGVSSGWFNGDRIKGEYKGVLRFNEVVSFIGGADWEQTGARTSGSGGRDTADLAGAFGQVIVEPLKGLTLTAGGRVDDHSEFGDFNTYRLTAAYLVPGTETKFRASRGTGFRTPSLFELYDPTYGNRALQPEESKSWDAGIEQGFMNGRIKLGATYFELDTTNLIDFDFGCFCYAQVPGLTERKGIELTAAARISSGVTLTAGYTYVDTELPTGAPQARTPKHTYVVGVDFQPFDKVAANVTARYVTDVYEGAAALDDYFLLSAKISYEFMPGVKAYVRGENLLDEKYQTARGYGTAGASVYGGFQFALPNN